MILQIILILPVLIGASFVAIVTTMALRRALRDMLPALSASAIMMGLTLWVAAIFPAENPWPLAIVVLGSHAVAFAVIRLSERRRG
jgi:hypothetical protein